MKMFHRYFIKRIRDLEYQLTIKQKKIEKQEHQIKMYALRPSELFRFYDQLDDKESQIEKLKESITLLELENSRLLSRVALLGDFVEDHIDDIIERIKNEANI